MHVVNVTLKAFPTKREPYNKKYIADILTLMGDLV